uniref:Uncharacterized protein n=1 Tax=Strongyloides venezuelensis TaxID=75913 RepID=A0A0K0FE89_STRVS
MKMVIFVNIMITFILFIHDFNCLALTPLSYCDDASCENFCNKINMHGKCFYNDLQIPAPTVDGHGRPKVKTQCRCDN